MVVDSLSSFVVGALLFGWLFGWFVVAFALFDSFELVGSSSSSSSSSSPLLSSPLVVRAVGCSVGVLLEFVVVWSNVVALVEVFAVAYHPVL